MYKGTGGSIEYNTSAKKCFRKKHKLNSWQSWMKYQQKLKNNSILRDNFFE